MASKNQRSYLTSQDENLHSVKEKNQCEYLFKKTQSSLQM